MTDRRPDYYAILGVAPTASDAEIHHAYRALVRRVHPDLRHNRNEGTQREPDIATVNEAWEVLGDPVRRAAYDRATGAAHDGATGRSTGAATVGATDDGLPPVPRGFRLYPRPAYRVTTHDWRHRWADAHRRALSLAGESRDLSSLASLGEDDLWLLDLSRLPVRDADLEILTRFRRLAVLLLVGCDVTDEGLRIVATIASLETLQVNETRITDDGLAALRDHPSLAVLDIRYTAVRGHGLRHLANLPKLLEVRTPLRARRSAREVFRPRPEVVIG